MSDKDTGKDSLADLLSEEIKKPLDTGTDPNGSVMFDEALIVLHYMIEDYERAEKVGENDRYHLPSEFAPQVGMKGLFERSLNRDYSWDPKTEEMKHKKCSRVYRNLKGISDGYDATISEKIKEIDTLIHEGLHNQCASLGGRFDRIVSSDDKFLEQH